jgi:cysteine desulfurase / selenocysteine lyase
VSGIVTFWRPGTNNMQALFDRLTSEHIVCSLRQDRQERQYLRFSPHFYNTEAEVDRVLAVLAK